MDSVVPKPSEVFFLINAGLWAETFPPNALRSFESIEKKKECKYNTSTSKGFIPKSSHQPGLSFPPCNFLTEKDVQKWDIWGSPPARWRCRGFTESRKPKSWVLWGFCNPTIKNLTKGLLPLWGSLLQNQVGIYLKSSVHRLRKEHFAGRERQKCRFLLRRPCVSGTWDPEKRDYTAKNHRWERPGGVVPGLSCFGVGNVCNYACRIAKREMGISGNGKYSPCRRLGIRAAVWQEGVNSPLVCEWETPLK